MHQTNTSSVKKLQPPRFQSLTESQWREVVRGPRPAAVLRDSDASARNVPRVVPAGAEIVRLGKTGAVVAGYRAKPRRINREFGFRLFRQVELQRLAHWRTSAGIRLAPDAWARAMASVAEPNVVANWVARSFPDLGAPAISDYIDEAARLCRRYSAQQLGDLVSLTVIERENLDIRSMRPAGMSAREFARYARERTRRTDQVRAAARRRAAGVKPRRKGELAADQAVKEGCSVATVYRRRRAKLATEACETKIRNMPLKIHGGFRPITAPPAWLLNAFTTRKPIPINNPGAPPCAARLGARVAAASRAGATVAASLAHRRS